ncbi:hypothetical protein HKCCE2091_04125 [Rhodobacterales bacterium HKCCE2091]|nr:hypothetical protein [Rhodobacterales bacterium HKCCE2091]
MIQPRVLPFLLAAGPALAAPGDPDAPVAGGWEFASCQMEAVCQGDGRCRDLPLPGQTYLWQDADGVRIGTSDDAARPIAVFGDLDAAAEALAAGASLPSDSILVTPPDEDGPGWFRAALFRVDEGVPEDRYFWLLCETGAAPPADPVTPPDPVPAPDEAPAPPGDDDATLPDRPPPGLPLPTP